MNLVEKIKEKLEKENLSVPKMAEMVGIPKDRIYKWLQEKGSPKGEDEKIINTWLGVELVPIKFQNSKIGGSLSGSETASALIRIEAMIGVVIDVQAEQLAALNPKKTLSEVRSSLELAVQQREEKILKDRNALRPS